MEHKNAGILLQSFLLFSTRYFYSLSTEIQALNYTHSWLAIHSNKH